MKYVKSRYLGRLWAWRNALLDGRLNLPDEKIRALGDTERQILHGASIGIGQAQEEHARETNPLIAKKEEIAKTSGASRQEYERLQKKTGRFEPRIYLSSMAHHFIMLALACGEAAFNLVAFDVFREPGYRTVLMALVVVIAIPLCAWFVGIWIRQWPKPAWVTTTKVCFVVASLVFVLIGMNRIRLAYLAQLQPTLLSEHPELKWAFMAANLVVLFAAALVTYLATDPEPGFAEAKTRVDKAVKEIHKIDGKLNHLAERVITECKQIRAGALQLIAFYRAINRRYRSAPAPNYFDDANDPNHIPTFQKEALEQ
jgi:hypothetical protein